MRVLYKYLKKEYAELLINKGNLRIGTLYEYRDIEKHGKIIGDEGEGTKSVYMEMNNVTWTKDTQPAFGKSFFNLGEGGVVHFDGITLEKPTHSPNYYMYCTTSVIDENALVDFGYDTCVVIENPTKFFLAVNRVMRHKGIYEGVFPCAYQSRRVAHYQDNGIHPAIIKPTEYRNQSEVRALWRPKKNKAEPMVIECFKARQFCKIL